MNEVTDEKELSPLFKGLISRLKNTDAEVGVKPAGRISIKGGVFTCIGTEGDRRELNGNDFDGVILSTAPVSRTYYPNAYDPDSHVRPLCWSSDTRNARPDEDVVEKQAVNCLNCDHNIKGSGEGNSRACRFHQRVAVAIMEEETVAPKVFQLQLPATSVFGKDPQKMSFQAYLKHLNTHSAPLVYVVTNISFDKGSTLPRLIFNPVRALSEEELALAVRLKDETSTQNALLLSSKSKSPFAVQEGFIYANNEDFSNGK